MTETEFQALTYLRRSESSAGMVGAHLWPERRSRGTAVQGGGDYAAQMLLGRLRKKGWTRVAAGEGSSVWEITSIGIRDLSVERTRRSMRESEATKGEWIAGFAVGLAEMHRLLIGGCDSSGVVNVARNAGLTLLRAKRAGVSDFDLKELRRAGVPRGV